MVNTYTIASIFVIILGLFPMLLLFSKLFLNNYRKPNAVVMLLYKGQLLQPKLSPEQAELQILSYTGVMDNAEYT